MANISLSQSFQDLFADFQELEYLAVSYRQKLQQFVKDVEKTKKYILPSTLLFVTSEAEKYLSRLEKILTQLSLLKTQCREKYSESHLQRLIGGKRKMKDLLRSISGLLSTLITSTDWQSPSIDYSVFPTSGKQAGKTIGGINDYKRDTHIDAQVFEKLYLKEYVDAPFKFLVHAYAVNSGMAAFSTILNFLLMEGKLNSGVLIGKNVYFQNKELLTSVIKKRLIEIEEWNTEKIIKVIRKKKPGVVYFDALSTSVNTAMPNIPAIIQEILRSASRRTQDDIYFLIDISCLSASFQIWKEVIGKSRKFHCIVFESLNKFSQFGLDREMGGIILAYGKDTGNLFEYRKNSGTIITHNSVYAIPTPNKKKLLKRIERHERNTKILAEKLQMYIDEHPYSAIEKIWYPGLPSHPSFPYTKNLRFKGTFFSLQFKRILQSKRKYQQFINLVLTEAKNQNVPIIEGTSFGLDTTRIYLAAAYTIHALPFIRIAVGTETIIEIEKIAGVLIGSMNTFTHRLRTKIPFL
ncbi:PLP-dependent transferase [Candidatus Gottesmanbacteria bacterium]|nr:PLP-dependent transferase [Candidatus Gottesmanbacteria bacterium]